jgi:rhodanese-related sulfurtransferase
VIFFVYCPIKKVNTMKRIFLILASFIFTANILFAQKVVSAAEFQKLLTEQKDAQLIDVRTPEEYKEGHLAKAKNINLFDDNFEKRMLSLSKAKPVFVYCEVGGRSGEAAALLTKAGYTEVYDLKGGIRAWKKEQKPIEK